MAIGVPHSSTGLSSAIRESAVEDSKREQIENWIGEAVAARQDVVVHGDLFAALRFREDELEDQRLILKETLKVEMMENEPSLSATKAEDKVRTHPKYLHHRSIQRDTVRQKDDASCRMQSARLRAEIALAAVKAIAGFLP